MMPPLIEPLGEPLGEHWGDLLGNESVTCWAEGSGENGPNSHGRNISWISLAAVQPHFKIGLNSRESLKTPL
jgi:hypothetical protein